MVFPSKFGAKKKLEFKQIILAHLKRILEISSYELRDTTRRVIHPNQTETIEQEDTRFSYIQAIENLSYILISHFDKDMQKAYDECIKVITSFEFEIKENFKKEYKRICEGKKKQDLGQGFHIEMKLRYAKKLLCALVEMMERSEFLKDVVFGEGGEDDESVEEDEGETE